MKKLLALFLIWAVLTSCALPFSLTPTPVPRRTARARATRTATVVEAQAVTVTRAAAVEVTETVTPRPEVPAVLPPNPTATVIRIATQSPLSGNLSSIGADIKNGAELALAQLKGPLEALGYRVELAPYDDQANPDTGVANARMIVADEAVLCVVGHYNSGVQIPSSELYHAAGLANVSPANTNPKVTNRGYKEVSRIVGRDDLQGTAAARFAKKQGLTRAFVLHDKTTYGQGLAEFFQREAKAQGIQVIGFQGTEEKANFAPLLDNVLSTTPDLIYFGGMYDQIAVFIRQARQMGYLGIFISGDGFDAPEASSIAGQALTQGMGVFFTTTSGPASLYPDTTKFQADFKARYGADPKPFAAQGYDAAGICLLAIQNAIQAGGGRLPTRAAVTEAVRALKDYPGITGTVNFNANGDLVESSYFIIQISATRPEEWGSNRLVDTLHIQTDQALGQ